MFGSCVWRLQFPENIYSLKLYRSVQAAKFSFVQISW